MADASAPRARPVTVLVAEDSPTQLARLGFLLEEAGFEVVTATNGREGLAALRARAVDLVISDVVMPELDGFGLCEAMRADPALGHLPVILLTSLSDPRDVIRGLAAGADNFVRKPFEEQALLARIRNVLANQALRREAGGEPGTSVVFAGQRYVVTADRLRILDLLLSTYEDAVRHNAELTTAHDDLRTLNEQLEARVAERTTALEAGIAERRRAEEVLAAQVDELRRWHAASLGREGRILELKQEVNELLAKLGQPPRYGSPEADQR